MKHNELKNLGKENKLSTCGTKDILKERLILSGHLPKEVSANMTSTKSTKEINYNVKPWTVTLLKKECNSRGLLQGILNILLKYLLKYFAPGILNTSGPWFLVILLLLLFFQIYNGVCVYYFFSCSCLFF